MTIVHCNISDDMVILKIETPHIKQRPYIMLNQSGYFIVSCNCSSKCDTIDKQKNHFK